MDAPPIPHPSDQDLAAYALGKLDDRAARSVDEHIGQCGDCRKHVAAITADGFLNGILDAQAGASMFGSSQTSGTQSHKPPPADTLPPGLADHPDYQIKKELGRGGMGVVYLAHNTLMGRDEVLKVMGKQIVEKPGVLDRFLREIRAVAKLRHPNIVTAYSAVRLGESIVFAMEYVEGYDLAKLVKAQGPRSVAHACIFAHQAALGLQHANEKGLVHRDVKPANLMLSKEANRATIKILDFGLAKVAREERVDSDLTSVGQALGTPDFIAPEQILDARSADIRADIYSLGGTLYYLLTGEPPFKANSLYDMYQAHISRDADRLNLVRPEVPSELAALVAKMMAKDPARRFQTPGEVARALTAFFKKPAAASNNPIPDVARIGMSSPEPPTTGAGVPRARASALEENPAAQSESNLPTTVADPPREGSGQTQKQGESSEVNAADGPSRLPRRVGTRVALGVLTIGVLAVALAGVLRLKTREGTLVVENPPEHGDIFVDGERQTVTITTPGGPVELSVPAGEHVVEVKDGVKTIRGGRVTIEAGGKPVVVRLEPNEAVKPKDENDGSIPLFNGKNLAGWRGVGSNLVFSWPEALASVDRGELVLNAEGAPGAIVSARSFQDYVLKLEYRSSADATDLDSRRGAVAFAFAEWDGTHRGDAFRCELGAAVAGTLKSWEANNAFPGEPDGHDVKVAPNAHAEKPAGEWNSLEVRCEGTRVTIILNGRQVNQVECSRVPSGPVGVVSPADIRFRNIRISPVHPDASFLTDPRSIVGRWRQLHDGAVQGDYIHHADGTIRGSDNGQKLGDWMQTGSKLVQRWPNGEAPSHGAWVFRGELSADGSRIEGTNQIPGQHFVLERIAD